MIDLVYRPIADDWPGELTEPHARRPSQFTGDWTSTLEVLEREVRHLTGSRHYQRPEVVLQLAVPEHAVRQDGQLRSGAKDPIHPGVIVNVAGTSGPLRFACDRFDSSWKGRRGEAWRHNLRAVAFGLEALRKVERYGLGTGTEQYVGFQALGSGTPMPAAAPTLTFDRAVSELGLATGELGASDALRGGILDPHEAWKLAAKLFHPDVAGADAHEQWIRLTEARDVIAAEHARWGR